MGSAMGLGLALGGLGAAGSLISGGQASAQYAAQAESQKAQAKLYDQQAKAAEASGRAEKQRQEEERVKLRRNYEDTAGRNRTLLSAGNVDMTSGSALDTAEGNAIMFAEDMGNNAYATAMKEWESRQQANTLRANASNARAQASSLKSASNNWFPTLLNTAISGASGFASGYTMAGGSFKDLWKKGK